MRRLAPAIIALFFLSGAALAQEAKSKTTTQGEVSVAGGSGMSSLLAEGYEIKTAVPNGTRFIVFLQKEKSAYACEFVTLTKSRCGLIN